MALKRTSMRNDTGDEEDGTAVWGEGWSDTGLFEFRFLLCFRTL
jgi:hypothetical protein